MFKVLHCYTVSFWLLLKVLCVALVKVNAGYVVNKRKMFASLVFGYQSYAMHMIQPLRTLTHSCHLIG